MQILGLFLIAVPSYAQRTVNGMVKEKDSGLGAVGVNVLLRSQPRSGMLGFSAVAEDRSYSISTSSPADTLYLVISGFNVVPQTKTWVKGHDRVDFTVTYSEQEIKESLVKAAPVKRSHDTLTYYVAQYRDYLTRVRRAPMSYGNMNGNVEAMYIIQHGPDDPETKMTLFTPENYLGIYFPMERE